MACPVNQPATLVLPLSVLVGLFGVVGDDLVDDGGDFAAVADLLEAFFFDDRIGVLAAVEHLVEDILGDLAGDGAVGNQVDQAAELRGTDRAVGDLQIVGVQAAEEVTGDPVGGDLRVAFGTVGIHHGFIELGGLPLGDQHTRIIFAQAKLATKRAAFLSGSSGRLAAISST